MDVVQDLTSNVRTITVSAPVNQPPVVDAGPNQSVVTASVDKGIQIIVNNDEWTLSDPGFGPLPRSPNSFSTLPMNLRAAIRENFSLFQATLA